MYSVTKISSTSSTSLRCIMTWPQYWNKTVHWQKKNWGELSDKSGVPSNICIGSIFCIWSSGSRTFTCKKYLFVHEGSRQDSGLLRLSSFTFDEEWENAIYPFGYKWKVRHLRYKDGYLGCRDSHLLVDVRKIASLHPSTWAQGKRASSQKDWHYLLPWRHRVLIVFQRFHRGLPPAKSLQTI